MKMHVQYGGEYTYNSGLYIPVSIYSPYLLENDIQVGAWMNLSWINPDNPSAICSMTLTVQDDYSIKADTPTENKLALKSDLSQYAKSDLSNAMTVSLGQNGYAKFNNGLLIQWGYASNSQDSYHKQSVYLPVSFASTSYSVVVTAKSGFQDYYVGRTVDAFYNSSFTVSANQENKEPFCWIAIGRWK